MLRTDFAQASIGLTLPAQKKHLVELQTWLLDGGRMLDGERVVALTNYQQSWFGRLPSQILLVTTERVAYTCADGFCDVPLSELATSWVDVKAGIIHGDITIPRRDGEPLTFRRGKSLAMAEVAKALRAHGTPSPIPTIRDTAPRHRRDVPADGPQASEI